jgi:hypothetical protein
MFVANCDAVAVSADPARQRIEDVTDTLERMGCYDTVGFEVITRFA